MDKKHVCGGDCGVCVCCSTFYCKEETSHNNMMSYDHVFKVCMFFFVYVVVKPVVFSS